MQQCRNNSNKALTSELRQHRVHHIGRLSLLRLRHLQQEVRRPAPQLRVGAEHSLRAQQRVEQAQHRGAVKVPDVPMRDFEEDQHHLRVRVPGHIRLVQGADECGERALGQLFNGEFSRVRDASINGDQDEADEPVCSGC